MATSKLRAEIQIEGASLAEDMIKAVGERAYNTLPLTTELAAYLFEISKARVEASDYAPLTPGTVRRKRSQGEDEGIFRDEWRPIKGSPTRQGDKLYRALTQDGAAGQLKRATRTWATFGVKSSGNEELFYARFVQHVGRKGEGKGTQRRILAITAEQATIITKRTMSYIIGGTSKYHDHPLWGSGL